MLATLALGTLLQGCAGDQITGPSPQPSSVRLTLTACGRQVNPNAPPPLFVVDDQPMARDSFLARGVRREDIVSLEVLKGPAGVARFGAAAEHGVLLIRTRSASIHKPTS